MPEAGPDFKETPEISRLRQLNRPLRPREKWKLRAATHEPTRNADGLMNFSRRRQINAKRFFRQQILARLKDVEINGLMQMVGNGDVDHVQVGRTQQLLVVFRQQFDRGHLSKPFEKRILEVAHRHELGLDGKTVEDKPASEGAGRFPAHQTAANDSDPHGLFHK